MLRCGLRGLCSLAPRFLRLPIQCASNGTKLTFAAKADIIRRIEYEEKRLAVAHELKTPRSMLSTLLRNKSDTKKKKKAAENAHTASGRLPAYDNAEKSVYNWFLDIRVRNVLVSCKSLQKEARDLACLLGVPNLIVRSG